MASLKALKIQNIRSVNDDPHVIKFLEPLTIIQGPNGTGKTTIIEALNFVTTGSLPSGKMQSFIHNDKKKRKVDALVQLEFIDPRENKCTATKRMTAAVTPAGKLTTKSDESTLAVSTSEGKKKTLSSKVADFNREMQQLLGVPSAVLQNVIFCHQEESNWPLSEPKELKLRFDAIFEVSKYVKAIDGLKKQAKESEAKILVTELPYLVKQQEGMIKLREEKNETESRIKEMESKIGKGEQKKRQLENGVEEIRSQIDELLRKENIAEKTRSEMTFIRENAHKLDIEPYEGTKEELEREIEFASSSKAFAENENILQDAQQRLRSLQLEKEKHERALAEVGGELTKMEASRMVYDNLMSEYEEITKEVISMEHTEQNAEVFLGQKISELEAELDGFDHGNRADGETLRQKMEMIRQKMTEFRYMYNLKTKDMGETEAISQKLKEELGASERSLESLCSKKEHLEVRLRKICSRESPNEPDLKVQLQVLENEKEELEKLSAVESGGELFESEDSSNNLSFSRTAVNLLLNNLRNSTAVSKTRSPALEAAQQHVSELRRKLCELEGLVILHGKWKTEYDDSGRCPLCKSECEAGIFARLEVPETRKSIDELRKSLALAEAREMSIIVKHRIQFVNDRTETIKESLQKVQEQTAMRDQLKQQVVNTQSEIDKLRNSIEECTANIESREEGFITMAAEVDQLSEQIKISESEFERCKEVFDSANAHSHVERSRIANELMKLKGTLSRLHFVKQKLEGSAMQTQSLPQLEVRRDQAKKAVEEAQEMITQFHVTIANCEAGKQRLRKMQSQLQLFADRERLTQLKQTLEDLQLDEGKSVAELKAKEKETNVKMLTLHNSILRAYGQLEEMKKKLQSVSSELVSSDMKSVTTKLETKAIQKILTQEVVNDLKKYTKALDDCIIAFHQDKMADINQILKELWPRVYQGNDIERIIVKSQPVASTDKRKSYDYSVVMVVNGHEIEMRDRCSAGQKVLASILIRIALAEVFGLNCPILALDEPTTNLDAAKVENIAEMLRDLLEVCNSESGIFKGRLQLIVITHDRRLVDHLFLACRPDYVYVLGKDENGNSHISTRTALAEGCVSY